MLAAITAGAALGFLVHNFHPASVFMGDCGSQPARPAARRRDRRGLAEDERRDRADRPAGRARRAVPGHGLRGRQADQVPAAGLPGRRQPLPPPLPPHRLLAAAHGALPVRLDRDDGRPRRRAALRPLLRPRRPRPRLDAGDGPRASRSRSPRPSTSCSCWRSSSSRLRAGSCATPTRTRASTRSTPRSSASSRRASSGRSIRRSEVRLATALRGPRSAASVARPHRDATSAGGEQDRMTTTMCFNTRIPHLAARGARPCRPLLADSRVSKLD